MLVRMLAGGLTQLTTLDVQCACPPLMAPTGQSLVWHAGPNVGWWVDTVDNLTQCACPPLMAPTGQLLWMHAIQAATSEPCSH